ncbi:SMP-30/gluconolactonase/LRE family protein [Verminephrobacter eiseniae]|uniref:SMP-30/gluconolactonase/LRE family protein n=1 Tax=Verminephrobacter eiseniae TaxID=364317 RepID=UPI002A580F83|nr:SMP-30/gluconolactonase/LRE family protein [Verminephrobacter eiseniae]MCW5261896.1 SMP-30/gluconolactonase/LRE family protein [Verminephrobacter eiseniae]
MNEEHRWECVAPVGSGCGEGALWVEAEQALYWTDVTRFLLHRLSARDGCVKSWFFEEPVVALSRTDRAGCLLVALGSRLLLWTPATDERVDHGARLRGWPQVRFNEGRSGPEGRFWVGSMRNNVNPDGTVRDAGGSDGVLMSVGRDAHSATVHQTGFGIANTLCWTPDQRCLIFGDTLANTLYCADYRADWADWADQDGGGVLGQRRIFFTGFGRGLPDGSAIDAQGFVWNCRFGGGCVVRIAPDGALDRIIEAPTHNPTTCAFGGPDYRTLYVTSARIGTAAGDRLAGGVFALRTEVPGLPSFAFQCA